MGYVNLLCLYLSDRGSFYFYLGPDASILCSNVICLHKYRNTAIRIISLFSISFNCRVILLFCLLTFYPNSISISSLSTSVFVFIFIFILLFSYFAPSVIHKLLVVPCLVLLCFLFCYVRLRFVDVGLCDTKCFFSSGQIAIVMLLCCYVIYALLSLFR